MYSQYYGWITEYIFNANILALNGKSAFDITMMTIIREVELSRQGFYFRNFFAINQLPQFLERKKRIVIQNVHKISSQLVLNNLSYSEKLLKKPATALVDHYSINDPKSSSESIFNPT